MASPAQNSAHIAALFARANDERIGRSLSRNQLWDGIAHNSVTVSNVFDRVSNVIATCGDDRSIEDLVEGNVGLVSTNLVNVACERFRDNLQLLDALMVRGFDSLATALHHDKVEHSFDPED